MITYAFEQRCNMTQKPMIVLTGPTAVGKTALSIELAKKINGAIISADSMWKRVPQAFTLDAA